MCPSPAVCPPPPSRVSLPSVCPPGCLSPGRPGTAPGACGRGGQRAPGLGSGRAWGSGGRVRKAEALPLGEVRGRVEPWWWPELGEGWGLNAFVGDGAVF